jgi:outer membrane protein insertion porin family
VKQEEGTSLISKVGLSLAYDTRNSTILPDRGQRTELLTQVAGGPLGGDKDFYKFELRSTWYFKGFAEGHIVEVTGRAGVAEQYGDTPYVPFYERWFLGGMYDVRGYKYRYVGPHDSATGEPVGGNTYMFGCVEYSVPVVDRVRFAVFYDTGTVNPKAYDFNYKQYNDNWGLGLRINIPGMGPLRFDYGIPIRNGNNSRSGKFNFGVGYTRDF